NRFSPWTACGATAIVNVAPAMFLGVGVVLIVKSEFLLVSTVRRRLTVFMIGSAGAGGPAATFASKPPKLMPVLPVKLPYERHSFRANTAFCGLFLKQTCPLIGFTNGGMITSGLGAPGRFANSWVAIRVFPCSEVGGLAGNLNFPVSLPVASKKTNMAAD